MKKIIALAPVAFLMALAGNAQAATQADVMLKGTIVNTTCQVVANNGAASLDVGSFSKGDFSAPLVQVGSEPLKVSLSDCDADEVGALQVSGIVGSANNSVFVSDVAQPAGFMLMQDDGLTAVTNGSNISLTADEDGNAEYIFTAGMTTFDASSVTPGVYNAPIKISYVTN